MCERGGLENVRDAWDEAVNLCATIGCEPNDESEMLQALGDCTDIVIKRLMPEGMEWPCFEDGEPVRIGDEVITHNVWQTSTVTSISLYDGGSSVYYRWCGKDNGASVSGKYVKRPTPKVLDADGEPLEVGQTVWSVNDGIGPLVVKMLPSEGEQLVVLDNDGTNFYRYPEKLTHKRPDSWERIEEDAKKDRCSYFRAKYQDCGRCTQLATSCSISKAFDLVRRCRALAERDR